MEYEYQIISLPLGEAQVMNSMPMQQSIGGGQYQWNMEAGATAVLMHLVRIGWEPVSTIGIHAEAASILMRKRVIASRGGAPH